MKKILFLALATMLSVAAMAQRERPTYNGATGTFLADETVYLLHVATNQFYCAGNDYGTHASLSAEAGIPLIFETTEMNNGDGLYVYQIKNLVPKDNAWKYAFLEPFVVDELVQSYQMYTDARAQPDVYFCIEDVEDGSTYRIFGSEANEECKHSGDFANFYVTLDPEYIDKDGNQTGTGIVYAASLGLGFAAFENIFYLFDNLNDWVSVGILRAFLSIPAHFFFAVTMGYFVSRACFGNLLKRGWNFMLALLCPAILHTLYDFPLMLSETFEIGGSVVFLVLGLYIFMAVKSKKFYLAHHAADEERMNA